MGKAVILLYEDIAITDELEVEYANYDNLKSLSESIFSEAPGADLCEVYSKTTRKLLLSMDRTKKGDIRQEEVNPLQVGGKRPGAGRKPKPKGEPMMDARITIYMSKEYLGKLAKLKNGRQKFIREAVAEKWLREEGSAIAEEKPVVEPVPKDRRYHKAFSELRPYIKVYDGMEMRKEPLNITKQGRDWIVCYGEPTDKDDMPCYRDTNLLNCVEHLLSWCEQHRNKLIIK